ncbi:hypothetical protein ACYX7E_08445 [Luteimonas sp. RIT-PG2_3]
MVWRLAMEPALSQQSRQAGQRGHGGRIDADGTTQSLPAIRQPAWSVMADGVDTGGIDTVARTGPGTRALGRARPCPFTLAPLLPHSMPLPLAITQARSSRATVIALSCQRHAATGGD